MKRNVPVEAWILLGVLAVAGLGGMIWSVQVWRQAERDYQGCEANLKNIGTALEMYSTDAPGRFPNSTMSLTPHYLKVVPTCPAAAVDTYTSGYDAAGGDWRPPYNCVPDAYTIVCAGHHHGLLGVPPNFPQYTSARGLVAQ